MATVADHDAECRSGALTCDWQSLVLFPSTSPAPTITHAEWRLVPTGEAVRRWTGLAVGGPLLVWPSDGAH